MSDICVFFEYNCFCKFCVFCICEIFVYDMYVCSGFIGIIFCIVSCIRVFLLGGFFGGILLFCRIRWNIGFFFFYSFVFFLGYWSCSFLVGCSVEFVFVYIFGYIGFKLFIGCNIYIKFYFFGYWLICLVEWLNLRLSFGFLCVCFFFVKLLKKIMKWF